jgi:ATP-dependent Clp protease ATP-binding subunit ClpC
MFERFTDRARKVMALANQEAQRFQHEYIGTEHILLGLVKEGAGIAASVLKNLHVDLHKVRCEVEKLIKAGPEPVVFGKLPQTPRAKRVIEWAIAESKTLGHNYVGTEHLLLGLLREPDGVAAQVLMNLGLGIDDVRQQVLDRMGASEGAAFAAVPHEPGEEEKTEEQSKDDVAVGLLQLVIRQFELRREQAMLGSNYELGAQYRDLLVETQAVLKHLQVILKSRGG